MAQSRTPDGEFAAARRYAHIIGWGKAVPEKAMTNDEIAAFVETNDDWIFTRTGIRQRYIAHEAESTATLAYNAARQALEVADILPADLDLHHCGYIHRGEYLPQHRQPGAGLAQRQRRRRI